MAGYISNVWITVWRICKFPLSGENPNADDSYLRLQRGLIAEERIQK